MTTPTPMTEAQLLAALAQVPEGDLHDDQRIPIILSLLSLSELSADARIAILADYCELDEASEGFDEIGKELQKRAWVEFLLEYQPLRGNNAADTGWMRALCLNTSSSGVYEIYPRVLSLARSVRKTGDHYLATFIIDFLFALDKAEAARVLFSIFSARWWHNPGEREWWRDELARLASKSKRCMVVLSSLIVDYALSLKETDMRSTFLKFVEACPPQDPVSLARLVSILTEAVMGNLQNSNLDQNFELCDKVGTAARLLMAHALYCPADTDNPSWADGKDHITPLQRAALKWVTQRLESAGQGAVIFAAGIQVALEHIVLPDDVDSEEVDQVMDEVWDRR